MRGKHGFAVAVGMTAALALSGCAGTVASPAEPSSTASPNPTPTSTPNGVSAPAQVFGGDCASVYSAAELSATVGIALEPRPRTVFDPSGSAVAARGGLECLWSAQADREGASVSAVILNSTQVAGADADETYCYGANTVDPAQAGACRISVTAGALWLSGVVYTPLGTTNTETRAAVASLTATFRSRATPAAAPDVSPAVTARWSRMDCGALSDSAQIAAAVQSPALVVSDADTSGGESPDGRYAAITAADVFACAWSQDDLPGQPSAFGIEVLPGGAWELDAIARLQGAEDMVVPGVERVIRLPGGAPQDVLVNAFDGVNWLQMTAKSADLDRLAPALPALITALNAGADGQAG